MMSEVLMAGEDQAANFFERRIVEVEDKLERLERNVQGDDLLGVKSLRSEQVDIKVGLLAIQEERRAIKYTLRGVFLVVGAGGLTSAGTLITVLRVLAGDAP